MEGRLATATLGGVSRSVRVAGGCLQGGVLSPLLWCLVVDELIEGSMGVGCTLTDMRMTCLLVVGKFPNTVSGHIQWSLHTI
jgi:hypothetical protein